MRNITKNGGTFDFSFMSYSRSTQSTRGVIDVYNAKLRKSPKTGNKLINDIMLHYIDGEGKPKRCYQPTIMTFNGRKVKLN